MTTAEAPINTTAALPEGLEEIIYASVERALSALLPHRRCRNRRSSKSRSKYRSESRSRSRSKSRARSRGNRSRSHSRGKHGHRKGPHHRILQSESETEAQQMEVKGHKGRHGMKHGYHFMRHGHHGMEKGRHGMRYGHHGMRHGHHGMRHGRHHGMRHCRRFPILACGAGPADQQKEGNEETVEVVDLVSRDETPSLEEDLQRGLENMNVGDIASVAGSEKQ